MRGRSLRFGPTAPRNLHSRLHCRRARPLATLLAKYPALAGEVKAKLQELKVDEASAKFLPLIGRGGDWVVILDSAGRLVHYVQAEGFF